MMVTLTFTVNGKALEGFVFKVVYELTHILKGSVWLYYNQTKLKKQKPEIPCNNTGKLKQK